MTYKYDILAKYCEIRENDRKMRHEALTKISKLNEPLFSALQDECEKTGHDWVYLDENIVGARIDKCKWCGVCESYDEHPEYHGNAK